MNKIHQWLCNQLCTPAAPPAEKHSEEEIREAAHDLSNAVDVLQGASSLLRKEAGALERLSTQMQKRRTRHG